MIKEILVIALLAPIPAFPLSVPVTAPDGTTVMIDPASGDVTGAIPPPKPAPKPKPETEVQEPFIPRTYPTAPTGGSGESYCGENDPCAWEKSNRSGYAPYCGESDYDC